VSRIVPSWVDVRKYLKLSLWVSGIGKIIGALSGTAGDIVALLAYDDAKRTTKNAEVPFG
jgi:putative tricarboxylic transport membrane protein